MVNIEELFEDINFSNIKTVQKTISEYYSIWVNKLEESFTKKETSKISGKINDNVREDIKTAFKLSLSDKFDDLYKLNNKLCEIYTLLNKKKINNVYIKDKKYLSLMMELCFTCNIFIDEENKGYRFCFNSNETCNKQTQQTIHNDQFIHFNKNIINILIYVCQTFLNNMI